MPLFIALGKATDAGIKSLEGFALRHATALERAETRGLKVIASYVLMGRYDYLIVLESPDAEAALTFLTLEAGEGNVTYDTFPATSMERFGEMIMRGVAREPS